MKLYLDSMLWVYYFESNPVFGPQTQSFVHRMRSARHEFLSSCLVLAEVLVLPKRNSDTFITTRYRRFFLSQAVRLVPLGTEVAEHFSSLRASTRVKPADALHLALAASVGTDYFITTDSKLHSLAVPGILRICPPNAVP
jgi:predicted nucleic acid-binding protein